MTGRIVTVTNLDSVRIEVLGGSRAVTIPASVILAIDNVLRRATAGVEHLEVIPVENDDTGEVGFEACLDDDDVIGYGVTAWGAIQDLERKIG